MAFQQVRVVQRSWPRIGGRGHVGSAQHGIALITALFVVALASIAAAAMLSDTNIALRRTENLQDSEAAWWYARGLQDWVSVLLQREARARKQQVDGLGDAWAKPVTYLPFDRGGVKGGLEDLQGRFNLNNLATSNPQQAKFYLAQFRRLLENIPGIDPFSVRDLGPAVRDWVDADSQPSGAGGAETQDYLGLDPPYRAANRLMSSASELLAVRGMTPQVYDALRPYVTALPKIGTKINVNTAPAPVLMSLADQISGSAIGDFIKSRVASPIDNVSEIGKLGLVPAGVNVQQYLDVHTDYFLLHADISVGSGRLALYSVLQRGNGGTPVVIAQSTGTD